MNKSIFFRILENRFLIVILVAILAGAGALSLNTLTIDALPDVSPVSVTVLTESPGMAPVEVEKQITNSIEMVLNGLPGVVLIRSKTLFGLSAVTVVFRDSVDIYRARSQIMERLAESRTSLPQGVYSVLGAVSTPTGNIFRYTLEGPNADLLALRTYQDWIVKRALRTVHGVASVLSYGGYVKAYFVNVDPYRLLGFHLSLDQVVQALSQNNENVGGGYIDVGGESYIVRGIGRIKSRADIGSIVVAVRNGVPVLIRDIGTVRVLHEVRRGNALLDDREVVKGTVLMLRGGNALQTLQRIDQKVHEINHHLLPPGIKIRPFYSSAPLILGAVRTVVHALVEGSILVILVLLIFLGRIWASFVVAITLPISILMTFLFMNGLHLAADLMSLGGIVIGIGMMVDASIVMVENLERHQWERGDALNFPEIVLSVEEVVRPILFSIAIISVVFLPILFLPGIPGKMFSPMAVSILLALASSLFLALAFVPVLMSYRGGGPQGFLGKFGERMFRFIQGGYSRLLTRILPFRLYIVGIGLLFIILAVFVLVRTGSEFIPVLDEGSVLVLADLWPSASMKQTTSASRVINQILLSFPEVELTQSRIGRAQSGTDTDVPSHAEVYVKLLPPAQWPSHMTKEKLVSEMEQKLEKTLPSVSFALSQPIQERIDEMVSGVKAMVAIKVFGDQMGDLSGYAEKLSTLLKNVKGVYSVTVQRITGQPYINIVVDREAISNYGLNVSDVNRIVKMGIGPDGVTSEVIKGVRRYNLHIRFRKEDRSSVSRFRALLITTPKGVTVPLGQLASIHRVIGLSRIFHENGSRLMMVQFNIRDRATSHVVSEIQEKVKDLLPPPTGIRLEYGGEFQNTEITMARLKVLVPFTILLVFVLLFWNFRSLSYSLLILLNIPFSMIGGILALRGFGEYLSVPASIGFIVLFGVAVQNGILLLSFAQEAERQGFSPEEAIVRAASRRVRPVIMTAMVGTLGIIPLMISHGTGANIQRPLAAVVVGGVFSSTLMTLLVLPSVYLLVMRKRMHRTT
ncbi:MAG: efflux RND transporter permease subunit [Leptospirales bacterium]